MGKPLIPDNRLVDVIRGFIADRSTKTTRPDMSNENHLLALCRVVTDEARARTVLWALESKNTSTNELEAIRQRVAELEKDCDEYHQVALNHIHANEKLTAERDDLLAALINHQEQTRPIQQTIDAIASVKEK